MSERSAPYAHSVKYTNIRLKTRRFPRRRLLLIESFVDWPCLDNSDICDLKRRIKCPMNFRPPPWILRFFSLHDLTWIVIEGITTRTSRRRRKTPNAIVDGAPVWFPVAHMIQCLLTTDTEWYSVSVLLIRRALRDEGTLAGLGRSEIISYCDDTVVCHRQGRALSTQIYKTPGRHESTKEGRAQALLSFIRHVYISNDSEDCSDIVTSAFAIRMWMVYCLPACPLLLWDLLVLLLKCRTEGTYLTTPF